MEDAELLALAQNRTYQAGPADFAATLESSGGDDVVIVGQVDWANETGTARTADDAVFGWEAGSVYSPGQAARPVDPTSSVVEYVITVVQALGTSSSDNPALLLQSGVTVVDETDSTVTLRGERQHGVQVDLTVDSEQGTIRRADFVRDVGSPLTVELSYGAGET